MNEPIADTVRGILDGHIVLDRKLAHQGHFPSINILNSVSRVMKDITASEHIQAAEKIKQFMAVYQEAEDLIKIGAYKQGANPEIDLSIKYKGWIDTFLKQGVNEPSQLEHSIQTMIEQFGEMVK